MHVLRATELGVEVTNLRREITRLTSEIDKAKAERRDLLLDHAREIIPPPKITGRKVRVC